MGPRSFLKDKVILKNLVAMTYFWGGVSFGSYMISFQLKYLPGAMYANSMASSLSEMLSYVLGGVIYNTFGIKKSFATTFLIAAVGGTMILIWGEENPELMPIFVTLAKYGISTGFVLVYIGTVEIFPTMFTASAFAICNFFARSLTIMAPQVAELPAPTPMVIFTLMSVIGIFATFMIDENRK